MGQNIIHLPDTRQCEIARSNHPKILSTYSVAENVTKHTANFWIVIIIWSKIWNDNSNLTGLFWITYFRISEDMTRLPLTAEEALFAIRMVNRYVGETLKWVIHFLDRNNNKIAALREAIQKLRSEGLTIGEQLDETLLGTNEEISIERLLVWRYSKSINKLASNSGSHRSAERCLLMGRCSGHGWHLVASVTF